MEELYIELAMYSLLAFVAIYMHFNEDKVADKAIEIINSLFNHSKQV